MSSDPSSNALNDAPEVTGAAPRAAFLVGLANVALLSLVCFLVFGPIGLVFGVMGYFAIVMGVYALAMALGALGPVRSAQARRDSLLDAFWFVARLIAFPFAAIGLGAAAAIAAAGTFLEWGRSKAGLDAAAGAEAKPSWFESLGEPTALTWLACNALLILALLTLAIGIEVLLIFGLVAAPLILCMIAIMAMRGRDPY